MIRSILVLVSWADGWRNLHIRSNHRNNELVATELFWLTRAGSITCAPKLGGSLWIELNGTKSVTNRFPEEGGNLTLFSDWGLFFPRGAKERERFFWPLNDLVLFRFDSPSRRKKGMFLTRLGGVKMFSGLPPQQFHMQKFFFFFFRCCRRSASAVSFNVISTMVVQHFLIGRQNG